MTGAAVCTGSGTAAGGAGGRAPCCVLGAGVGRRGCVGVVRNRMTGGQNISK